MLLNKHCKGTGSLETIVSLTLLVEIEESIKKLIVIPTEGLAGGSARRKCAWRRKRRLFASSLHTILMVIIYTPVRS